MEMIYNLEKSRFELNCTYSEFIKEGKREIIKGAGFRYDPETKTWWTDDTIKAIKLGDYAVGMAIVKLQELQDQVLGSRANDLDIDIPCPDGLSYRGYQKAGIGYGMNRKGIIIADEMGLGKTIQALGIINTDESIKNVLVVCPASVKSVWKNEAQKWLVKGATVIVYNGAKKEQYFGNGKVFVHVTNYDNIHKEIDTVFADHKFDVLICDECHKLKNYQTIRACAVLGGECKVTENKKKVLKSFEGIQADRRIFLTGTPIVNRPVEFAGILNSVAPETFPKIGSYLYRYCDPEQVHVGGGRFKTTFQGASHTDELNIKLRSSCMIRRLKNEVLTELPDKIHNYARFNVKGASKLFEQMAQVLGVSVDDKEAIIKALNEELDSHKFIEISKIRHQLGLAKCIHAIDYIKDLIESGEKVLVFAHHTDVLDKVQKAFENTVRIDGSVPTHKREEIVRKFQEDESVRAFFGSIRACGEGLTLTKASQVVFIEQDWTTGAMAQAEDRAHRIGQESTVVVHHILADMTLDEYILNTLISKGRTIKKVLDVKTEAETVTFGSKAEKKEEAPRPKSLINEDQRKAVHEALRMLAGVCDGAYSQDGSGFNKFDADFGKSMAFANRLSDNQFKYARKMVIKYKRQIPSSLMDIITGKKSA